MARHNKGILNEFSGKVDTVVGSSWNGIPYIRGLPSTLKKRKPSELQVARQARFALGVRLIQSMGELTAKCFKGVKGKTAKNEAMSRLLSQAVCGTYPDLRFDYSQVEIARGQLKKAEEVSAVTAGPGQISLAGATIPVPAMPPPTTGPCSWPTGPIQWISCTVWMAASAPPAPPSWIHVSFPANPNMSGLAFSMRTAAWPPTACMWGC